MIKQIMKRLIPGRILKEYRYLKTPSKKKREKLIFEIHLVEHCNLNCKSCNNFSCLAEPSFLTLDEFKRDLLRLRKIFASRVEQIQLLGGEPLLHPELEKFCSMARDIFPEPRIRIVTNGTLLMKQEDSLWKVCRDYNIEFNVTRYPIRFDYDSAKEYVAKKGIKIDYGDDSNGIIKTMSIFPVDPKGKQDPKRAFFMCGRANTCISLKHGKLYPCTMIPNVYAFNKQFNENIPVTDEDMIDIYKESDPDKILQRMTEYFPICRYCNPEGIVDGVQWEVTKKQKSEWVLEEKV